jgi:hypothetical protein
MLRGIDSAAISGTADDAQNLAVLLRRIARIMYVAAMVLAPIRASASTR